MKRNQWKKVGSIIGFLAVAALALSGCSGDDGATGATGPAGPAGPAAGTNASTMTLEELGAVIELFNRHHRQRYDRQRTGG